MATLSGKTLKLHFSCPSIGERRLHFLKMGKNEGKCLYACTGVSSLQNHTSENKMEISCKRSLNYELLCDLQKPPPGGH